MNNILCLNHKKNVLICSDLTIKRKKNKKLISHDFLVKKKNTLLLKNLESGIFTKTSHHVSM